MPDFEKAYPLTRETLYKQPITNTLNNKKLITETSKKHKHGFSKPFQCFFEIVRIFFFDPFYDLTHTFPLQIKSLKYTISPSPCKREHVLYERTKKRSIFEQS